MVRMSQLVDHSNALEYNAFRVTRQRKAAKSSTLLFLAVLAACTTTPKGSFCDIASPIRPANVDVLTDADVAQILAHNEKLAKICGIKP